MRTARSGFWRVAAGLSWCWLWLAGLLAAAPTLSANESRPEYIRSGQSGVGAAGATVGELLEAEREGLVAVRYIPNDSRSAQVIVTNRTKKPLTLRLPAAFVGTPVLAQVQQAGAGFGAGGIGAQPQTVGGGGGLGAGAGGGGFGGMGAGGGAGVAFSLPPEKSRVLKVRTVCLEHGKAEPQPRQTYRLDRLDSFSSDPALRYVLESLGRGEIGSQVAQAAAWHLSSGLSWEQIASERIDHVVDEDEPFFTVAEILAAKQVVAASLHARRSDAAVSSGK